MVFFRLSLASLVFNLDNLHLSQGQDGFAECSNEDYVFRNFLVFFFLGKLFHVKEWIV